MGCQFPFQFLGGYDAADAHVGASVVVSPEAACGVVLHLRDCCKIVLAQPLVPDGSVVALDIGVLLRLAGLDMENRNGLVVLGGVSQATGTAEREIALAMIDRRRSAKRVTLGADKAYDFTLFVHDLRDRSVTPHIAIDGHARSMPQQRIMTHWMSRVLMNSRAGAHLL